MILVRAGSLSDSSVIRFDDKIWIIGGSVRRHRKAIDLHVRQLYDTEWVWITLNRRDLVEVAPRQRGKWQDLNTSESEPDKLTKPNLVNPLNYQE